MSKETKSDALPALTDKELFTAAYSGPKLPKDFAAEKSTGNTMTYFAGENVAFGDFPFSWHEFSAATKEEAEAIALKFLGPGNNSTLKENKSTDCYFEFTASATATMPERIIRVHKTSCVDSVRYNWPQGNEDTNIFNDLSSVKINFSPITAEKARSLFDFLWLSRFRDAEGSNLVKSIVVDKGKIILYSSVSTRVVYGDWNMADKIYLIRSDYEVSKKNGSVTIKNQVIKEIAGKTNNK